MKDFCSVRVCHQWAFASRLIKSAEVAIEGMQCIFNTLICLFLLDFHFWQQTNTPSQCWYNCSRNSLRVYALNTITFSLTLIAISLSRMSRFINEIYLTQVPAWCGGFKVMEMQFLESLWAISLQIRPQRVEGLTMRLEYDRMTLVSSVSKLILCILLHQSYLMQGSWHPPPHQTNLTLGVYSSTFLLAWI